MDLRVLALDFGIALVAVAVAAAVAVFSQGAGIQFVYFAF
jgi:hypothetical protein